MSELCVTTDLFNLLNSEYWWLFIKNRRIEAEKTTP